MLEPFASMWGRHPERIFTVNHGVDPESPTILPIHSVPYHVGPKAREFEKLAIDSILAMNLVKSAQKECASPIVFAPKKEGPLHLCVDYRKLNALTIHHSYPLPRMDECISSLGEAQVFSTLNANIRYWQIEVEESDKEKKAFTYHLGLHQFTRM